MKKIKIELRKAAEPKHFVGSCRVCGATTDRFLWPGDREPLMCGRCIWDRPRERWPEWTSSHALPAGIAYHPLGGQALAEARAALSHFAKEIMSHAA